jgi:hypothetical protein
MERDVVPPHDVLFSEKRAELVFQPPIEELSVTGALQQERGLKPLRQARTDQGGAGPSVAGDQPVDTPPFRSIGVMPYHRGLKAAFVNLDKLFAAPAIALRR